MTTQSDYDVIIVGTGIAGYCAALEAVAGGGRVLMIEAEDQFGGSSRLSTGMLMAAGTRYQRAKGIENDTPQNFLRHYMDVNNWQVQPSLARRLCFDAGSTVDWLEEQGVEFLDLMSSGTEDLPRGHVTRGGESILECLRGRLDSYRNVDTVFKTRVSRILLCDGAVRGVASGTDTVTASAVVLAVGGMGADPDMVSRWQPSAYDEGARPPHYLGARGSRGDAIRFADQLGAQVLRGRGVCAPIWKFGGGYLPRFVVLVNALGRRFMNESWGYGTAEAVFTAQPGATAFAIFDEATKAAMLTRADIEREMTILPGTDVLAAMFVSKAIDDLVTQGMITKAESLTQLARILDLPEADLLGTMARYNHLCERGFDEDFFKTARLRTVAGPPFYAFQLNMAGFALTTSGIRIDHNASVVHRNSNAIPGLFAAGECTGGIIVRAYVGSGNGLANASTFGRIAGRNAAAFARSGSIPPLDWSLYGMSSEDHH